MINWRKLSSLEIFKSLMFTGNAEIQTRQANGTIVAKRASKLFADNSIGRQAAPAAKTTSTTLTAAEILGGLITGNQGAAGAATYTLPLGADLEGALLAYGPPQVDDSFDFSVINLSVVAAEDITIATNTGWTLVGTMVVESNEATAQKGPSGTFRARRTAANAFSLYRMS